MPASLSPVRPSPTFCRTYNIAVPSSCESQARAKVRLVRKSGSCEGQARAKVRLVRKSGSCESQASKSKALGPVQIAVIHPSNTTLTRPSGNPDFDVDVSVPGVERKIG